MVPIEQVAIPTSFFVIVGIIAIWEGVWKLIGLWKAGRNKQLAWFICIGVLNTAGILPIVYLLFFQKNKDKISKKKPRK